MSPAAEHRGMDDIRVGRVVRALRRRHRWTQDELARSAGISQSTISLLDRGQVEAVGLRVLRRVLRVLDAQVELEVRWRGGELDRVLDEAHARLVAATMTRLRGLGWEAVAELTYAVYRERGAIDIVAWRGLERALLIVEVKSELTTVEATLRRHDEKVRLAANVVRDRFGWVPRTVSRLLVLPESRTARRRVQAGDGLIARSYPLQGVALRRWLRAPGGAGTGLLFLAGIDLSGSSRRIRRLRAEAGSRTASDELGPSAAAGG